MDRSINSWKEEIGIRYQGRSVDEGIGWMMGHLLFAICYLLFRYGSPSMGIITAVDSLTL